MPTLNKKDEDGWKDDFALLMNQLEELNKQGLLKVGTSPKELIYKENKLRLFRYQPLDVKQKNTPLLITYALVNSPYIVDLEPRRSLVLRLLEQGYPVFLIDWGYPDSSDCCTSLGDYINGLMHRCVQQTKRFSSSKKVNLLGVCQGGVFSLCYATLYPHDIKKLITLVTPVDFHSKENLLSHWTKGFSSGTLANNSGNIPNYLINQLFKALKPFQLNREKYRRIAHIVNKKENLGTFLKMEQWLNDGPDLAGQAAGEFIESFYKQNSLQNNSLAIEGKKVSLKKIKCPVLNLYASKDHIVPPSSAMALGQHIEPMLYKEQVLNSGHIGAFTSLNTQRTLVNTISSWLK